MTDIVLNAAPAPARPPIVCIHEDRIDCLVGVKLLVLSTARHCPAVRLTVSCPGAPDSFVEWLSRQPNATRLDAPVSANKGWNVKPSILLHLLRQHADVVWVDSDIVVAGDFGTHFHDLPASTMVVAEEPFWGQHQGGTFRTIAWGLQPGRSFASTINSGVLRVTREHVDLLTAWQAMLSNPLYVEVQKLAWYERPLHMIGDQEVLTGLLASADFAHVPLRFLRRGRDIAQCFGPAGFTPSERIRAMFGGGPEFVHAMGPKPWLRATIAPPLWRSVARLASLRRWYEYLSLDVSPYRVIALGYCDKLGDATWTRPLSLIGRMLSMFGRTFPVPGFPLAVFDHGARWVRRAFGVARYSRDAKFILTERPF